MQKTKIFLILTFLLAVFVVGYGWYSFSNYKAINQSVCKGKTLQNTTIKEVQVLGFATSSSLFEVYSDYQCPFCARYYVEAIKPFIKDYVETGKMKLLYRDIAFEGEGSQKAALAARCANDQGKFWEYHDKLVTNYDKTHNPFLYDEKHLIQIAKDLGLDECEFILCFQSGKYNQVIKEETQKAFEKIRGTPTSFLNNQMLVDEQGNSLGAMSYQILQSKINEILGSK